MRSGARSGAIPLLVFCAVLAIIISGCSAGGDSGTSIPTTLAWDAPSTYEDGTSIESGALTGYRIYVYTDPDLTARYAEFPVSGPVTSIKLSDLTNTVFTDVIPGTSATYYLAVNAVVTVDGIEIESAPSNSVSYTYP